MWQRSEPEVYRIGLDVADPALAEALAEAIEAHPALVAAGPDEAPDLVIADRAGGAGAPAAGRRGALAGGGAGRARALGGARDGGGAGARAGAGPGAARPVELTRREREVLALMVDGAPNKAIARALGISARTAKFHVAAILGKLHAPNRAAAVAIALREGLVVL